MSEMYRRMRNKAYLNVFGKQFWSLKDFTIK